MLQCTFTFHERGIHVKKNLGIASVLFLLATLILKLSGLGRDVVIAYYFGDSYQAGAFLAAFTIPNMLILFFTTGMKNALVPSYIESLKQKRGEYHLNHVFTGTILIGLVISVVGALSSRYVIPLMYPEFSPEATELAIVTMAIFFTAIFFVGMNAVLEAFFDAENKFALSITSQIIVVVSSILGMVLFVDQFGIYSMAYGYVAGAIISLLFKLLLLWSRRLPKVRWNLDFGEVKQFYIIFVPVALTVAVGQINLTVDNIFAGFFSESTISYINYARHLVQFPQAMFGVTIGTIIFPLLSKAKAENDQRLFKRGMEQGLMTMFFILAPALAGMMFLMPHIVEVLFERGEFLSEATQSTVYVAYMYAGSVLFFSLHNVVNKGFYSLKKGHLILMIGSMAIVLNAILNYVFTKWMGYLGIPLASSVMAALYVGASFLIFLKLVGGLNLKRVGLEWVKILSATAIMMVLVLLAYPLINAMPSLLVIGIVAVIGAISYGGLIIAMKTETVPVIINRFKK